MVPDALNDKPAEVEFFGVRLKVNNPRLAALLNSDVTEDVHVVSGRAREVLAGEKEGGRRAPAPAPGAPPADE